MSEAEDAKIAQLEKELLATEQMLYHVLTAVGHPVVVTKEELERGVVEDSTIDVSLNEHEECFIFSIQKISDLINEQ